MEEWTIKGFPRKVEVNDETSLRELERLLLRAFESRNLSRTESEMLLKTYKDARRKWLDSQYELNDEHMKALKAAADRIITAVRDTIDIVCRTLEREALLPKDERTIRSAHVHLEEEGLPLGIDNVHEMTDDEIDLWDLLFYEDCRDGIGNWGFPMTIYDHVTPDDYKDWRKRCEKSLEANSDHDLPYIFWNIRDRYNVALQDMARIQDFQLTVEYEL